MNQKKTMQKRDIYLVFILLVVFAALFLVFQYIIYAGDAASANIYYRTSDPIVSVDFASGDIRINYSQDTPGAYEKDYPFVTVNNDGHQEIVLLGDYEINGLRQEVIVEVDFDEARIRVRYEESPQNICSKQGWSTAAPLICLPNRVRVEFDAKTSDIDIIQ